MATLAKNTPRSIETGNRNGLPVIAADIIFEGAAVGVVEASGHTRPLAAGDTFAGFAEAKLDNSAGAAAADNVRVIESGKIQLTVAGVVITDVGQPVYASDDDTFTMNPVGGVFVGFVHRWVSSGVCIVSFDAAKYQDPYGGGVYEAITGAKTLDIEDVGKTFFVTTTAVVTLPAIAVALRGVKLVCMGGFGTVQISASPAAADLIAGPEITAADDKDIINTLATAQRGDFIAFEAMDATGWVITGLKGTWAREA